MATDMYCADCGALLEEHRQRIVVCKDADTANEEIVVCRFCLHERLYGGERNEASVRY